MPAPDSILELVERFKQNRDDYRSGNYKEAQLRKEFIDPFFTELGWDMNNSKGYAEAYKDVIHEDSIKIGNNPEAPDYCFRIGGARKFFLEAKKPSVNIKHETHPAYQLRRYAWSSKLPMSILTDFEEFAVYDCRVKPVNTDDANKARIKYFTYDQYPEKWDYIESVFSREAVLKGNYDRHAETNKGKKGTAEVDTAFLDEIESWRIELARNIALRNPGLSRRELNFTVQRTIDRIIFLRICEDRSIEEYQTLHALLNGANVYPRLCEHFYRADQRYNSGLFHFQNEKDQAEPPDELSTSLKIDDKPLKSIIKRLYYPDSPYEFSVLPADILGQVYEQFLGKVIRLTDGHHAVVEDKPEVKKAGGVFYTPTYIVDYIVKNTVGALIEGKTPDEVSKLRILDPACGSGSFLIGAYQFLLDWHLKYYAEHNPEKWMSGRKPRIVQITDLDRRLTTDERKRILLNNIYGVDIDTQAVEVTKLSLLLKVLEGETKQSIENQFKLFRERALPDLASNIKCGNSLIGSDYYEQSSFAFMDEEERYRINVFDWKKEFPEIFNAGGFDAVIGNPPYVRQETLGAAFKEYAQAHFSTFAGTADLYVYFFEQAHKILRTGGLFGMICSNKFMRANYGRALRDYLAQKTQLIKIVDFGELPVFQGAATFPAVFLTEKSLTANQKFTYAPIKRLDFMSLEEEVHSIGTELDNRSLSGDNWTLAKNEEVAIFDKMKKIGVSLGEYVKGKIFRGVLTGLNEAFVIDKATRDKLIAEDPKNDEIIKTFVSGDDIRKYNINFKENYLILIPKGWTLAHSGNSEPRAWFKQNYPALTAYLVPFRDKAEKRCDKGDFWWELRACDYYKEFEMPKIVWPEIAMSNRFCLDNHKLFLNKTCFFSPTNDMFLLGFFNSKLNWFYLKSLCSVLGDANKRGRLLQQKIYIEQIPIRVIDFTSPADVTRHDRMVSLVTSMLELNRKLADARTADEKTALQRIIDATDQSIDKLVYELYGMTEEEIRIVEGER